ncbi:MAG: DUF2380 domain-containing protein [Chitinophagaceae bacterium]|nr:DUF2380 domain-containing protein [Chitinophagaceae bacterium]MBN8666209.1 DUF2380 domain-containing protein [Chitinophagales bacterium]
MKGKLLSLFLFFILGMSYSSSSQQAYIYGPTNVNPGDQSYYTAMFDFGPHTYSYITWNVQGGTIVAKNENPTWGMIYCIVQWDYPGIGYLSIYEDMYGQYGELAVEVGGAPVSPGYISANTYFFNYLNPTPTITQTPATDGNCGGVYDYFWEHSPDGVNWSNVGYGESYPTSAPAFTEKTLVRRGVYCGMSVAYTNVLEFNYQSLSWENRNFIKTNDIWYPGKLTFNQADNLPIGQKQQSTIFFDGISRPEQQVMTGISPSNKDLVVPIEYDALGRDVKKHLAYQAASSDGKFKPNAIADQQLFMATKYPGENSFFAETRLEASPLNRSIKSLAPGLNWGGSDVGIQTGYDLNGTADAVRIWRIDNFSNTALPISNAGDVYPANTLYKIITTDERGKLIIEYKDKEGEIILRKQQLAESGPGLSEDHLGWLCTYYVYNDFGQLRYMIQPKAVESMRQSGSWVLSQAMADGLCFKYVYDSRGRLIEKKDPDAAVEYMVYDSRDRLVFSQHGNQRDGSTNSFGFNEWSFFLYDVQNRQVASGVMLDDMDEYTRGNLQYLIDLPSMQMGAKTVTIQTDISETLEVFNPAPIVSCAGCILIEHYQVKINAVKYYDVNTAAAYTNVSLPYASNFENIDPASPSQRVRGIQTKTKVRVLDGTNKFINTVTVLDEKGRVLQTLSANTLGASTSVTNQYDFAGKVRGTVYKESRQILVTPTPIPVYATKAYTVVSKYEFDHAARPKRTIKNVINEETPNQSLPPVVITTGERVISEHTYDDLGQLLSKTLAPGYAGPNGPFLEKLDYEYNIRGWMTGINKEYAIDPNRTDRFFGMELGYDKPGNSGFGNLLRNGNVAGMAWKTAGDNILRKFDYLYDNANRITQANFGQKNTGTSAWTKDLFDFSMNLVQYDYNGNITRLEQNGVNFNGIVAMDRMSYGYDANSNRLKWVTEDAPGVDHKLGDFTDKNQGAGVIDYTYDFNGNLTGDLNKGIQTVTYNYLNLPEIITVPEKGSIRYIYDANGSRLQKIVTDITLATGPVTNTTTYSGPLTYTPGNDVYVSIEDGRIRYVKSLATQLPVAFTIDYFIKDHLGNVRMVLTEEEQVDTYPVATMETATTALEDKYYRISNRTDKPIELQGNTQYDQRYGQKMSKLSTQGTDNRVGPSILLKVMAGDLVQAKTDYYYRDNGTQVNSTSVLTDLVNNLINHLNAGNAGVTAKAQSGIIGSAVQGNPVTGSLVTQQNSDYVSTRPKAFINYIVFDEGFNPISKGVKQVQANGPLQAPLVLNDVNITKNGWIYVFVNNESQQPVYFDNFQIVHNRGHILEENHYSPFGLTLKAISPRALSVNPVNFHKFSDKEFQSEEFSDGTSLDEYDFGARQYNPQIGRWNSIDPKADEFPNSSPYAYAANNPTLLVDKDGKFVHLILKYGINVGINIGIQMITAYMFDPNVKSWGDAWDKASVWDALWESASDMIGNRALRMAGDGIMGMFHYMDDVGFRNITGTGLMKAGFMGILEPLVYKYIGKYGAVAVEKGLKKMGIDQNSINRLLGRKAPQPKPKIDMKAGKTFSMSKADKNKYSPNSYRDNLKTLTGVDPGSKVEAHHIFPKADEFKNFFDRVGIDVNDPIHMQWWDRAGHNPNAQKYNAEWRAFMRLNPNADKNAVLQFGRDIMSKYGLNVFF